MRRNSGSAGGSSSTNSTERQALLNYFLRERLYHHAVEEADAQIVKRGNDPFLLFWRAFALGMEGAVHEAITDFDTLRSKRDYDYAVVLSLLHFHRRVQPIDREAVATLEATRQVTEEGASDASLLSAARLQYFAGNYADADRIATLVRVPANGDAQTPMQAAALAVKGWIAMAGTDANAGPRRDTISLLERSGLARDLDIVMAKAKYHSYGATGTLSSAMDHLNHAIALQSWFWPALVEKAKLFAWVGDWDQALDSVQRILNEDADNVPALRMLALAGLVHSGSSSNAAETLGRIKKLAAAISKREGRNAALMCETAASLARVCGREAAILQITINLAETATRLDEQAVYFEELGYQLSLAGSLASAADAFHTAARLSPTSVAAVHGQILCQVLDGVYADAAQQLELLALVQGSEAQTPRSAFLHALLNWRKDHRLDLHEAALDEARDSHERYLEELQMAGAAACDVHARFIAADPDFMVRIGQEYLLHPNPARGTTFRSRSAGSPPSAFEKGILVLESVLRLAPAALPARLVMAKSHYASGAYDKAATALSVLLAARPDYSPARLLSAQVAVARGDHRAATSALEQALAGDFTVRSSPVYHLARAQALKHSGSLEEAREALEEALRLPGVRDRTTPSDTLSLTARDRAAIFLELADIASAQGDMRVTKEIMAEAQPLLQGTPEEVHVLVASSELAIRSGEFDRAVKLLTGIAPDSPIYVAAQMVKASVYLSHRHDKRAYAQCYRDLVAADPSPAMYVNLGDAFMRIQMPEAAVEAFEIALDMDPSDAALAAKTGRALISTHNYRHAMDYLRKALRASPGSIELCHDLGRLCLKLGRYVDAVAVLGRGLIESNPADGSQTLTTEQLMSNVSTLFLLSEVHEAAGDKAVGRQELDRAKETQRAILDRLRSEVAEVVTPQRNIMTSLCRAAAERRKNDNDSDGAIQEYTEALELDAADELSLQGLSKIYLARNDLAVCLRYAATALRMNDACEWAALIQADVMFLQSRSVPAMEHYRKLLASKPNNYEALSKLMGLLRRAGVMPSAWPLLRQADTGDPRSAAHAGLHYCKGLVHRYTNNVADAIKHFNATRRDGAWGALALHHMIELYVNPHGDLLWEVGVGAGPDHQDNLRVAEVLLQELKDMTGTGDQVISKAKVHECYIALASRKKDRVDTATAAFGSMLEQNNEYLPALLGVSISFMIDDQPNKARNTLKRIAKMPYAADMADEFETSYLLLAYLYVDRGKFDLAQDLCKRCLSYNLSCGKAWEAMGLVMEKECSYRDAAEYYEKAWTLGGGANAAVGFKLSFNYLKAERFVDAIDICNKVLAQYPGYPKIREEILDVAFRALRP